MKSRKGYYVVENIKEVDIIFNDQKMVKKIEEYLVDKKTSGEIYCKVIVDKESFSVNPKLKTIKTIEHIPDGDTDYIKINNFLI